MCLYTNKILILLLLCQASSSVKNSLTIFAIISTGIKNLPDLFTIVIDDIQVDYYDGNGIRKQSSNLWKNISDSYQSPIFSKEVLNSLDVGFTEYLIRLGTLNPDEAVHVLQCMIGCELDEKSAEVVTFQQCGYNGEDFMKLYSKNMTWTAQHPLAEKLKPLWDSAQEGLNNITLFLTLICPQMLEKFVTLSALQREDLTSVALLQKTPSSPVNCFATGFYPNAARMFWMRDGMEIQNDKEPSEILPNHDNTYQMSVYLNVSSIASDDWKRYDCVFRLGNKTKLTRLEKAAISTNWVLDPVPPSTSPSPSSKFPLDLATGLVVGLILLCFCITGLFLWKNVNSASKFPDPSSYPTYPGTIQNCQHNFEIQ
ncbi:major histocompatibility complex class I-related gene protein-like isoform X2 [Xiphophorus maculatus]|uniref:Major histocompatibility complex class I-related gene protein-like n=1 Tax=Xiphophorus maculatus TaxID=8083 RepID=M4AQ79_XIPMA|nr:major histocompatibility complex class I-related gene protein-like isoform X2 [Xiphophorus maculatus]